VAFRVEPHHASSGQTTAFRPSDHVAAAIGGDHRRVGLRYRPRRPLVLPLFVPLSRPIAGRGGVRGIGPPRLGHARAAGGRQDSRDGGSACAPRPDGRTPAARPACAAGRPASRAPARPADRLVEPQASILGSVGGRKTRYRCRS
jgi:hypothetical protein